MTPKYFLEAFGQLCEKNKEFSQNAKIVFVGRFAKDIKPLFMDKRFRDNITIIHHLPHKESLQYLLGADLLLLLIPDYENQEIVMTTKLFEYIKAKKPIFALSTRGRAACMIEEVGNGFLVEPKNIEEIKIRLSKCYDVWKSNKLKLKIIDTKIRQLDRKYQT